MRWFGSSSASAKPPASQDAPQTTSSSQTPAQPPPSTPQQSSDIDPEVQRFLKEVMDDVNSTRTADQSASTKQQQQPPSKSKISRWATSPDPNPTNGPRLSPLAESLLPTTMSCEQAFNFAFYCQSLGGQWNAIYRYGSMRDCSETWGDFFFCMRQKGTPDGPVKENMIREHYRQKILDKYGPGKPSSEDVWAERKERVPPGTAFAAQSEAPAVGDAEYQRWEVERMARIRKGLPEGEEGP